jgi:predicted nucleic acid-binding protein
MRRRSGAGCALDTSCIVAVLCSWHERHGDAVHAVTERLRSGAVLFVPAHALVETYAVLTRLPAPHRVSPEVALRLLRENFGVGARIATLSAAGHWATLEAAAAAGVIGGGAYDALVAAAARNAAATTLLTLNLRHLARFGRAGFDVIEPGGARG